jgi:hypothetical protein
VFDGVAVAVPLPIDEVVPKAGEVVVPPKAEVEPKIDGDAVLPVFLLNAVNVEAPVLDGLPNVSPLEVPDPKVEGEDPEPNGDGDDNLVSPEPNVVDPDTPIEKGALVVGAAVVVVVLFDVNANADDDDAFDSVESPKPTKVSGLVVGAVVFVFFSSTTTHAEFSGVEASLASAVAVAISIGLIGKSSTDPNPFAESKAGSFMC